MLTKPTKCIRCGRDSSWCQDGNVTFDSNGGNDGSKYYDNIGGGQPTFVRLVICDSCFLEGIRNGLLQPYVVEQIQRPQPKAVKWDPIFNTIED